MGLHLSDWMDREFILPSIDIPDLSELTPENAAIAIRAYWHLGETAILNMIALLESHGARVFSVSEVSDTIDAFSFWSDERSRAFVFLTTSKSAERRRMDAAHELGHLVLHRKTDLTGKQSRTIETEADRFASSLLMPESAFRSALGSGCSLGALKQAKQYWGTSLASTIYRAHQLNMISDWKYHDLFKNISKLGYRRGEPGGIAPETSQVLDQIIEMSRQEHNGLMTLAKSVDLPLKDVLSLAFRASVL